MPYKLQVIGNKFEVAREAAKRGIPFVFSSEIISSMLYRPETFGLVSEDFIDKIHDWEQEEIKFDGTNHPLPGTVLSIRRIT